jgi:hypothetical protein
MNMLASGPWSGFHMQVEHIEKKKREYTDKYVVVDASQPELARFKDIVGQVKTVNMSGRALVEFMDYHLNIGWYDIDPDYLKVVDKPPPKVEKPAAKKPAAKAEAAPAAAKTPAKEKPQAAPAKATGKPSVADILAAARGGKAAAPKPAGEAASAAGTAPAKAAPPPAPAKPAAAKVDRSKMSVADMLAAARAGGAGGATAAPAPAAKPKAPAAPAAEEATAAEEEAMEEAAVEAPAAAVPTPAAKSSEKIDKSKMSIEDMLAWCRQHDAK